jgi:2-polyprenyl-6-methoxyphenol hydroxylase-like FAD-dependent oxidoreductase
VAAQFDVIIVGGRCAGAPLAALLARAGMRVCVVDRAEFPSDTPSTHGVQPSGVKILDRLGVLDQVLDVAPAIEHATVQLDDDRIEVDGISRLLGAPMVNVRRVTLDAILLNAAATAGADVRTQTAVSGLLQTGGRVVGVQTTKGELRAPLVVGADGARSTVADLVGARKYHETPPGRMFVWTYLEGVASETDRVRLGKIGDHVFLASPTDSDLFMVALGISMSHRDEVRRDREAAWATGLAGWPDLQATVAGARRVGPVRMMSRWHGFFRESAGPGWVLLGDAGHFKDPTPGQGIADALRQSTTLAAAIQSAATKDAGAADRILDDWWSWRDEDAWEMYWYANDMGVAGTTPLVIGEIQRRIAASPQLTHALFSVLNHDLAPSKAFTTGLGLAAISTALRINPGQRKAVLREARDLVVTDMQRRFATRRPLSTPPRSGLRARVAASTRPSRPG